jgi:hypothetical protein
MPPVTGIWRLRATVLTLVGALVVHQGRYLLAPGAHDHALAGAHGYLAWLMPLAGTLLFLTAVQLAVWVRRRSGGGELPDLPPAGALWLTATLSLLSVFAIQESAETFLTHGYLPTLGELLAHGGTAVVALAGVVGGLLALALKGAAAVIRRALREPRARRPLPAPRAVPPTPFLAARTCVLARFLAGRAPPTLS